MAVDMRKAKYRWGIVAGGLLILAAVSPFVVRPVAKQIEISVIPDPEAERGSGLLRLFRGLQMSFADICYNKAAIYTHSGIRYSVLEEDVFQDGIEQEQHDYAATAETTATAKVEPPAAKPESHEDEHKHAEESPEGEELMIPPPEKDFRGIIGEIERRVKPYPDTIVENGKAVLAHPPHVKPEESLPWLRLATLINPEHQQAWVAAASVLQNSKSPEATRRAIALLEQALKLNPLREGRTYDKYSIVYLLAHYYLTETRDYRRAWKLLVPAVYHGKNDFPLLDEVQRDWLNFVYRDAVETGRYLGLRREAAEIARLGIGLYPDDRSLHRKLRREEAALKEMKVNESNSKAEGKGAGK